MQLPVSASPGPGLQNVSGSFSSGALRTLAGGVTAKKKQVAPFAAILAEQSPNASALKDGGVLPGTKDDNSIDTPRKAALLGAVINSQEARITTLHQPKMIEGVFSDLQSDGATMTKDETECARPHKMVAATSSDKPTKTQKDATTSDSSLLSAAMAPVPLVATPPTPVVMGKGPHFTTAIPLNHSLSSQIASAAHDQKLEAQRPEPVAEVSSEFAKPEATLLLAADSVRHEIGPDSIPSAKSQPAPSAEVVANIAEAGPQVIQLHNPAQIPQNASTVGLNHGVNITAVSPAGQAAQNVAASSATVLTQKLKLQNKTSDDAVRKLDAVPGLDASSTGPSSSSGSSLMLTSSTHAAAGDASAKQAATLSEANAFQHLDAGESPATLLHSSAHQVTVGVLDPSLGWVEVQTQSSAGHISATLTAASLEAHASLAAQAPAITQYLVDQNVSVHSMNVHIQTGAQNGNPGGGGQPQSGSGGRYQGPPELRSVAARASSRSISNETINGNMPALNASRISIRA